MKVIISGLTAAGKTTAARHLANCLSVPYYSASDVLREKVGDSSGYWTPEVDRLRRDGSADSEVDKHMKKLFETTADGVFDAWGLPWFSTDGAYRIWLESDRASRNRKCQVSWLERGFPKNSEDCNELLTSKDDFSRQLFLNSWGFDIFINRGPFDLIVDLSSLIPAATIPSATTGIDKMNRFLEDFVRSPKSLGQRRYKL